MFISVITSIITRLVQNINVYRCQQQSNNQTSTIYMFIDASARLITSLVKYICLQVSAPVSNQTSTIYVYRCQCQTHNQPGMINMFIGVSTSLITGQYNIYVYRFQRQTHNQPSTINMFIGVSTSLITRLVQYIRLQVSAPVS